MFVFWAVGSHCISHGAKLTRRKRYVAFPEGAAFSAVFCMTAQTGINTISEGINWGFVYDLPNDTLPLIAPHRAFQKRRNRRDVYVKLEDILTSIGYNGRSCILRTLCEAEKRFEPRETSLARQLLNIIFRFPKGPIGKDEPDDHRIYHWASLIGRGEYSDNENQLEQDCSDIFTCPFSLIDMALGYHSINVFDMLNTISGKIQPF
ncbi:hypothetical protein GWI33_005631 [Rhynchophorus ferrugineus]|uniref:Uncharacterized protein n=1 Tax=Rhynchophorus ferrugineus TaxID=354439 RepID=A0A834MHU9_RHYFE|nr:hypothetical protein GWI33_005631 [Rhynchophorus ferrugineus]